MALTATITKFSVEARPGVNDFMCTINVEVKDEASNILLNRNYSKKYNSDVPLDTIKQGLQDEFIADWNEYESEQDIFNTAAFDTLVGELQAAANQFINQ